VVELEFGHVESVPPLFEGGLIDVKRLVIEYDDALEDGVPIIHLASVLSLLGKLLDADLLKRKAVRLEVQELESLGQTQGKFLNVAFIIFFLEVLHLVGSNLDEVIVEAHWIILEELEAIDLTWYCGFIDPFASKVSNLDAKLLSQVL